MCTAVSLNTDGFYFGRTLDIECGFGEQVVITPRNYPLHFRMEKELKSHFAIIGMSAVSENYPLYADAMNEKGLCMAGLKFPDNAFYPDYADDKKRNISPFELIPWVLSQCSSADEAEGLLKATHIIGIPFSERLGLSPLHWIISDKKRSIVLESTKNGTTIYDDPIGILTNNPPFDFHLTNLRQYLNITSACPESRFGTELEPFSNGFGAMGLPGDFSSCSRFVRAAFLKLNSACEKGEEVPHFFRIAEALSLPKGCVYTKEKLADYTLYACCMDAERGVYYYRTYSASRICGVSLNSGNSAGTELLCFPLKGDGEPYCEN
ncbi:MAG: choloylglycine hydrolase [Oscillospiraceae bacterium]|nr:choloylglycine hydrolase [Oscillospiraceae bacterium]